MLQKEFGFCRLSDKRLLKLLKVSCQGDLVKFFEKFYGCRRNRSKSGQSKKSDYEEASEDSVIYETMYFMISVTEQCRKSNREHR